MKKLDDMTPNVFKASFEIILNLYNDLEADYKLMIGERRRLSFFNAFILS